MKYANVNQYYPDMPSEAVAHIAKAQARELLDTVLGGIEKDKWYAIRMSEIDDLLSEEYGIRKQMIVEIEPCREQTLVYKPPERMLMPSPSLKEKLKNCIKYLKDKSGGSYEIKEIKNECID